MGPIPTQDGVGKEIVAVYSAPTLNTRESWYTDSNGRDSMLRTLNKRPSWNLTVEEPIAGNFYPTPGFIFTCGDGGEGEGSGACVSVVPDRAVGGSSLSNGTLTLMIHRRLTKDDSLGVFVARARVCVFFAYFTCFCGRPSQFFTPRNNASRPPAQKLAEAKF